MGSAREPSRTEWLSSGPVGCGTTRSPDVPRGVAETIVSQQVRNAARVPPGTSCRPSGAGSSATGSTTPGEPTRNGDRRRSKREVSLIPHRDRLAQVTVSARHRVLSRVDAHLEEAAALTNARPPPSPFRLLALVIETAEASGSWTRTTQTSRMQAVDAGQRVGRVGLEPTT